MQGIITILFVFVIELLSAQLYIGGGYSYQSGPYKAINQLVDAYNGYRPQQIDQLDALSELHGPSIALGLGLNGKAVNLDVGFYGAQMDATRFAQNQAVSTLLEMRQTQVALAFGVFPEEGDQFALGFNLGLVYASTTLDLSTTDPEIGTYSNFRVDHYNSLGVAPAIQTFVGLTDFLFFYFKPSYVFDLFDNDSYTVHKALNPLQFQNDDVSDFEGRFSGLQIEGGLVISFSGR